MIQKQQKPNPFSWRAPVALGVLLSISLLATAANASVKQGHLQVSSKVQKMVQVVKNGQKVYEVVPAKKVLPGEIVQYDTFFQNISDKAAENINIVNPIPTHTVYLPNSAHGQNTQIVFSVDGGKSYAAPQALKVRGNDGKIYPAKPSDYTHIRWHYNGQLPPDQRKAVGFRVRLK